MLAEEAKHLTDIEALLKAADPAFATRSKTFEAVERTLYEAFIGALSKTLAPKSPVAAAAS